MGNADIWIFGAGRFGRMAVKRFTQRRWPGSITVVDRSPEALERVDPRSAEIHCGDCVDFIDHRLALGDQPQWIVPAVPIHLACEWLCRQAGATARWRIVPVPEALTRTLPNVMTGRDGAVYTSIADFLCPDDCPAPEDRCTVTGRPRPLHVHRHLERFRLPGWRSAAILSHQLLPGVGGIRTVDLMHLPARIFRGEQRVLLSTACACHGVIHALAVSTG